MRLIPRIGVGTVIRVVVLIALFQSIISYTDTPVWAASLLLIVSFLLGCWAGIEEMLDDQT